MGASLWDQLWLPLLISVASSIVVTALCCVSVRLRNCLIKQIMTATGRESTHSQNLPDGDAAAHANGVPDLETGSGHGHAEGRQSMAEPELELRIVNSSDDPKAQVIGDATRGALEQLVKMDVPQSQREDEPAE